MDTTNDGRANLREVQISILGPEEIAGTGETKEERKRLKQRAWCRAWRSKNPEKARAATRRWRIANKNQVDENSRQWRTENPEKISEYKKRHYQKNRQAILAKSKSYYENNKDRASELNKKWKKENHERKLDLDRAWREKNRPKIRAGLTILRKRYRAELIEAYGGACKCCGKTEPEFLSIDHIDGGGSKHRKKLGGQVQFYRWLRVNNYPKGFQILCHDCNQAKGFYGICPHQQMKTPIDLFFENQSSISSSADFRPEPASQSIRDRDAYSMLASQPPSPLV